jgi:putative glutamine amidotransferase
MASTHGKARPLIGMPLRYDWDHQFFYLRQTYAEAVYGAGGMPVYIPLIPERDYLEPLIDRLDGVMLSGSNSDVDPLRYGANPHPKLGPVLPRRDATDALLIELAEERGLPLLAICYGFQALNVYRGGTLVQDIPSQVDGALKHMQEGFYERHSHTITIAEGTLLAELAGASATTVNSHHHQAIERLGRNLTPIAWAPDGIIEAVIDETTDQWVFGVQWHPEVGWSDDPLSRAVFGAFLEAADAEMGAGVPVASQPEIGRQ